MYKLVMLLFFQLFAMQNCCSAPSLDFRLDNESILISISIEQCFHDFNDSLFSVQGEVKVYNMSSDTVLFSNKFLQMVVDTVTSHTLISRAYVNSIASHIVDFNSVPIGTDQNLSLKNYWLVSKQASTSFSGVLFRYIPVDMLLRSLPEIGDTLITNSKSRYHTMTNSANFSPAYDVTVDGIEYTIAVDEYENSSIVRFIWTRDKLFCTREGFRVGDTYDIFSGKEYSLLVEPGWGNWVELLDDWRAFWGIGPSMTSGPVERDSEINGFFKR